jgi:peptide/nickel transport system permease protein
MLTLSALLQKWMQNLRRTNLPLLLGLIITLIVIALALWGDKLAPNDPMQENYSLDFGAGMHIPPYPPLKRIDYPLGTDRFGRDLYSRILWGVRPTLILVTSVAAVRLGLALLIGLLAGWSTGQRGRLLDGLISAALAVPVLFVALAGITLVGIDKGLIAFVVGLAVTGWADTARLIAAQTKAIKQQTYVEMSYALGASTTRTLLFHILPQIMPLVWMLLAFELGATLLVAAELGFLGYYIGGGVWIEVYDFVTVNTAGLPELGQMLSQALVKLTDPSAMIVVGSVLFVMVLGFNLLGEGLRLELMPERMRHRNVLPIIVRFSEWWHFEGFPAIEDMFYKHKRLITALFMLILVGAAGLAAWNLRPAPPMQAAPGLDIPGGHLWASERHDAQGTRFVSAAGPQAPQVLWTYQHAAGLTGGPAVRNDGVLIVNAADKQVLAFDAAGQALWQVPLAEEPVGSPALNENGDVYVSDQKGGLTYIPRDAAQAAWRFQPQSDNEATSGPIVARSGNIYYTVINRIQAVTPQGEYLWRGGQPSNNYLYLDPRLSPQEGYIFLQDSAMSAASGTPQSTAGIFKTSDPLLLYSAPEFFIGPDRKSYMRVGHGAYLWHMVENEMVVDSVTARTPAPTGLFPFDAGAVPSGYIWLFYTSDYMDNSFIWLNSTSAVMSVYNLTISRTKLIAVDENSLTYICGDTGLNVRCLGINLNGSEEWSLTVAEGYKVVGGAVIPGRVYVTTQSGLLAAIGDTK